MLQEKKWLPVMETMKYNRTKLEESGFRHYRRHRPSPLLADTGVWCTAGSQESEDLPRLKVTLRCSIEVEGRWGEKFCREFSMTSLTRISEGKHRR